MPSSSQAGTVPSILSVLSNCYKRSKHLTMFVMFSYLLAMKCFLAVTEWAVDVPSTRCRDFNYPGAVQDLETLSSGGEIRNISGSSHCRLKPLGTQLSYRNYLLSICLWCGRYRNRNRRNGHILRHAHTSYILLNITVSSTQVLKARGYACNPHHRHACSSGHLTRSTPRRGQDDVVKGKVRFVVSLCWDNCGCLADNLPSTPYSTPHHWTLRQSILSVILYYYDKRIRGREKNYPIKKDYYVHYMFSTPSYYHEWQWVILACWLHNIPANCPVLTCDIAWDLPINIKRNQPKWSYKTLVVDILNFYHKTC